MANVEPIRKADRDQTDTPAVEPVFPGVEAALVQAIDEKRSLSIKTMFLRDTPPADHERVLASLFSVTAVVALREKIMELKRELGNTEKRLSEVSVDAQKREKLESEIATLRADMTTHRESEIKKLRDKGYSGDVLQLEGAAKNKQKGFAGDIEKKNDELKSLEADAEKSRDDLRRAIKNWSIAIENAEREIAIRREAYGE